MSSIARACQLGLALLCVSLGLAENLNVHIVCHTHDDVGWLKTVDQYYYGTNNDIRNQVGGDFIQPSPGVQYILDSVVHGLMGHPDRKFMWVEIAFFQRWWREQDEELKAQVTQLVQDGQLEFVNGAWGMNDEANPSYVSVIDQYTVGHRFLEDTFGVRPRVAWSVDPFGHSQTNAAMLSLLGYDAWFLGRIDWMDQASRLEQHRMEFLWRGSQAMGSASDIFTFINYNVYWPMDGFCFDASCKDEPIQDDPTMLEYNVNERAHEFIRNCQEQAQFYETDNILLTAGMDFYWSNANMWYKNLDKLMAYINARPDEFNATVLYSTPSLYMDAVHEAGVANNLQWPSKSDSDMFPYASDAHNYWTGYYTSRSTSKHLAYLSESYLRTAKQIKVMATDLDGGDEDATALGGHELLSYATALMQHHDAITGTAKQHVADDYNLRLDMGMAQADELLQHELNTLVVPPPSGDALYPGLDFTTCHLANISVCDATQEFVPIDADRGVAVLLYNPLAWSREEFVRVPVEHTNITVVDAQGVEMDTQLLDRDNDPMRDPTPPYVGSAYTLVFKAVLPAVGYATYFLVAPEQPLVQPQDPTPAPSDVTNGLVTVTFSATGLIEAIEVDGTAVQVTQDFLWYESSTGSDLPSDEWNQASGVYIFRTEGVDPYPVNDVLPGSALTTLTADGPLVWEVTQVFSPWVSQIVRLYQGQSHVETEWLVGDIPVDDGIGRELITRFSTDLNTGGDDAAVCFTDTNGRDVLRRVKNQRADFELTQVYEPVAGNYYPIDSMVYIEEEQRDVRLSVLVDRPQGGGALHDGEMEIMLRRRILRDDGKGVFEIFNETDASGRGLHSRGTQLLLVGEAQETVVQHHLHRRLWEPVQSFFAPLDFVSIVMSEYRLSLSGLSQELPPQVHLLSLEVDSPHSVLLRLENMLSSGEPVSVDVHALLTSLYENDAVRSEETTASGNTIWADNRDERLAWSSALEGDDRASVVLSDSGTMALSPKDLRTVRVYFSNPPKTRTAGHIAAIVIGSIVGGALLFALAYMCLHRGSGSRGRGGGGGGESSDGYAFDDTLQNSDDDDDDALTPEQGIRGPDVSATVNYGSSQV